MIAAAGPSALWYLNRGTGLVTLLLLTASVVLGILQVRRWGSPRFVVVSLHRAVSLLVVAFLAGARAHRGARQLRADPPRRCRASLRRAATGRSGSGLGALAFDLLVALTVTSLLRHRLGLAAWRAVHWLAYVCWPLALVHGWGTGSDTRTAWMLATTLACAAAVVGAITWRLAWPAAPAHAAPRCRAPRRSSACSSADGWRSVRSPTAGRAARGRRPRSWRRRRRHGRPWHRPFSSRRGGHRRPAHESGWIGRRRRCGCRLSGEPAGVLRVRIAGVPAAGGGVTMRRSAVTLGPGVRARGAPGPGRRPAGRVARGARAIKGRARRATEPGPHARG